MQVYGNTGCYIYSPIYIAGTIPQMMKKKSDRMLAARRATQFLESVNHSEDSPKFHWWKGQWWTWTGSKWGTIGQKELDCLILNWLMEHEYSSRMWDAEAIRDVIAAKTICTENRSMPFWNPPVSESLVGPWLNMKNWLVNPERLAVGDRTHGVKPKSSRWFGPIEVPYDYNPDATCPEWEAWLARMMPDQTAIDLVQEYFGYLLVPDSSQHAALFLLGDAGTGKSTVGYVAKAMIGEDSCSSLNFEGMASQYGLNAAIGKYLNVVDETSLKITTQQEMTLKWYISGQPMTTNKKYADYLSVKPTARLIVATNQFPEFHDQTDGIWRRIKAIRMNKMLGDDERDPRILDRLRLEAPGIFVWALRGLKRLREQGRFTEVADSPKVELKGALQTTKGFINDFLQHSPDAFSSNAQLEAWYKSWCSMNAHKPTSTLIELKSAIIARWPACSASRRTTGKREWGMRGVALRLDATGEEDDD